MDRLFRTKKGATQPLDVTETLFAFVLILLALLALLLVSNYREEQVKGKLAALQTEAPRMQAVRTYVQTPIVIQAKTYTIAEALNEYYALTLQEDLLREERILRRELRSGIYDAANLVFDPLLSQDTYDRYNVTVLLHKYDAPLDDYYRLDLVSPRKQHTTPLDINITLPAMLGTDLERPGDYEIVIMIQ